MFFSKSPTTTIHIHKHTYTHTCVTMHEKDFDELGPIQQYVNNFFPRQPLTVETDTSTQPFTSSQSPFASSTPIFINHTVPNGFLVWNPGCEMPSLEPLAKDVMRLFHREKYEHCSKTPPLTTVQMNWTASTATLAINQNVVWYKAAKNVSCCYQEIRRSGSGKTADEHFK